MRGRIRPPLIVVSGALLGLIALLATLQYRWLGQISAAERDRMRATSTARAADFAQDFDRELARAYLVLQAEPAPGQESGGRVAAAYDRWQATTRFPRLIKAMYVSEADARGSRSLARFDPTTRQLQTVPWPPEMSDWRERLGDRLPEPSASGQFFVRRVASPLWGRVPALLVPLPMWIVHEQLRAPEPRLTSMAYAILVIDVDYAAQEVLPALAERYFKATGDGFDYLVAVLSREPAGSVVYRSTPRFSPKPDDPGDASADLFQVRVQDFTALVPDLRQMKALAAFRGNDVALGAGRAAATESRSVSVILPGSGRRVLTETAVYRTTGPARWRVVLKHPSGSLEAAVNAARRRNLMISSSILAVLGASMALLILSTRRAQDLARRQMEFVAGVTHELRTPLAVLRSAGDNLADGVVHDPEQVRKYGELVRTEGRRLSDMVEQVLEFSGMESGRRGLPMHPVDVAPLVREVISSSKSSIEAAGIRLEVDLAESLPPVLGDETTLRRVFHNLIGNAIKYGADGGWIRVRAMAAGPQVWVEVADGGIGIAPAEHARVFEPFYRTADVVAAQIQGAGLGLSLVKRIVDAHGGRVTVKSEPGAGAEFTVLLPIASRRAEKEPAEARVAVDAPDPHST